MPAASAPNRSLATVARATAIAAVITQGGIAVTGSVVRVTGSGLGCPTWPQCFPGSLVPEPHPDIAALNQWIEFGNRLLTGLVGFVGLACLIVALLVRPRRRRLILLAATMPLGVAAQAILGGITVLTGLAWWTVAAHFLVSMVLVWLAVLLVAAFAEGDAPARWHLPGPLRGLLGIATAVLAALLIAGTLVTAAGPHAGDIAAPRLTVGVPALAQLHADLLIGFLGLLAGLGFALRAVGVPTRTWRCYTVLVGVVLAQGALGVAQYLTGVPEVLVSLHVLGAASVVVAMAACWTGCRARDQVPLPGTTRDSARSLTSADTS
ncbi:MAG: COX15/CtaA family protein [Pseudonocardiaceae bacterium]